ncbi:MAG: monovalent cation/H+ antiporter subunit D [Burkholderiaceae bacterium]
MAGSVSTAPLVVGIAPHLIALPILLPLLAGSLAAAVGGFSRRLSRFVGLVASALHLVVCVWLMWLVQDNAVHVYQMGNWSAPFGIVIVLDRLSALMLLLTSTLSFIGLMYANAAWSGQGRRFQALWQYQMMGLCGAFLTGDLFNLFVFFEVLLAASYALLLHGGGRQRVGATFHFVVINLTASAVFLIALALFYSVTGTLNMAHMAQVIATIAPTDVGLVGVCAILLLSVFMIKAGLFPFHFWVPASYGSAAAPVVALVVAKVGAYAILRVYPLIFGDGLADVDSAAASLANLARPWLLTLSVLTLLVGSMGVLASQTLRQLAATLTLVSIGTLFVPLAVGSTASLSAAVFYLLHSTVATATLFIIAEWVGTHRGRLGDRFVPGPQISHPILIGGALLWALITSVGLPPTSGFIGKVLVLESLADARGAAIMWVAILVSSFCALIAVSRALSLLLWNNTDADPSLVGMHPSGMKGIDPPQEYLLTPVQSHDGKALGGLIATILVLCVSLFLVAQAGLIKRQTLLMSQQIVDQGAYVSAVMKNSGGLGDLLRRSPARPEGVSK